MKRLSSKRAKACAIPASVKQAVAARDSIDGWPCCLICGSPAGLPEAHYISRARGGLGIEENIVTLCRNCHNAYDNGTREQHIAIKNELKKYLQSKYENWNESDLIYDKDKL